MLIGSDMDNDNISPFMEEQMQNKEVLLVTVLVICQLFIQDNKSKRLLWFFLLLLFDF